MNNIEQETIKKAISFAHQKHGDQKYGNQPYTYHLNQVVNLLIEFGYEDNPLIICVGWLHDVLEDTDTTMEELQKIFGIPIAYAVWTITSEDGTNRKSRLQSIIQKLRSSEAGLVVKLADRIANTEECKRHNAKLFKAYVVENEYLRKSFYNPKTAPHLNALWQRLLEASTPKPKTTKSHVH